MTADYMSAWRAICADDAAGLAAEAVARFLRAFSGAQS